MVIWLRSVNDCDCIRQLLYYSGRQIEWSVAAAAAGGGHVDSNRMSLF